MKKIYFLINSLKGGGAERQILNLAKNIENKGIILLEKDIQYETGDLKIIFLSNHTYQTNRIFKIFYLPIYAYKLAKVIEKDSIVISFLERANFVNIISKIFKKHKSIISIRLMPEIAYRGFKGIIKILMFILYRFSETIVPNSKYLGYLLEKKYKIHPNKIKVIYNPIDLEQIKILSQETLGEFEKIFKYPVLINSGRLTFQKGQWYLLRVFKTIKEESKDFKLVILGQGPLKNYLVNLSKNLGLKTYSVFEKNLELNDNYDVYFLGFQKNPFKFLKNSKIFILTSFYEGLPNVLLEALACNLLVISADCFSGPREILAPNTDFTKQTKEAEFGDYGILLPVFDIKFKNHREEYDKKEKVWIKTLNNTLNDKKILNNYFQKNKNFLEDFNSKIINKWENIIKKLII